MAEKVTNSKWVLQRLGRSGDTFVVNDEEIITIGRDVACKIACNSELVSRYHCFLSINQLKNRVLITNNTPMHGTYVNNSLLPAEMTQALLQNDVIGIGCNQQMWDALQPDQLFLFKLVVASSFGNYNQSEAAVLIGSGACTHTIAANEPAAVPSVINMPIEMDVDAVDTSAAAFGITIPHHKKKLENSIPTEDRSPGPNLYYRNPLDARRIEEMSSNRRILEVNRRSVNLIRKKCTTDHQGISNASINEPEISYAARDISSVRDNSEIAHLRVIDSLDPFVLNIKREPKTFKEAFAEAGDVQSGNEEPVTGQSAKHNIRTDFRISDQSDQRKLSELIKIQPSPKMAILRRSTTQMKSMPLPSAVQKVTPFKKKSSFNDAIGRLTGSKTLMMRSYKKYSSKLLNRSLQLDSTDRNLYDPDWINRMGSGKDISPKSSPSEGLSGQQKVVDQPKTTLKPPLSSDLFEILPKSLIIEIADPNTHRKTGKIATTPLGVIERSKRKSRATERFEEAIAGADASVKIASVESVAMSNGITMPNFMDDDVVSSTAVVLVRNNLIENDCDSIVSLFGVEDADNEIKRIVSPSAASKIPSVDRKSISNALSKLRAQKNSDLQRECLTVNHTPGPVSTYQSSWDAMRIKNMHVDNDKSLGLKKKTGVQSITNSIIANPNALPITSLLKCTGTSTFRNTASQDKTAIEPLGIIDPLDPFAVNLRRKSCVPKSFEEAIAAADAVAKNRRSTVRQAFQSIATITQRNLSLPGKTDLSASLNQSVKKIDFHCNESTNGYIISTVLE